MGKKAYLNPAADALGIAPYHLRQMAKKGEIPCLKSGNRYVFDIELCEEFLKNEAMKNVKPVENVKKYGVLRRVGIE